MEKTPTPQDYAIVRELAHRVAEIAALPVQKERRDLWKSHNSLHPVRPMILIFPEGGWSEIMPESVLQCQDQTARGVERELRQRIHYHEHFSDDTVIEAEIRVPKAIRSSGWGLQPRHTASSAERGAWAFEPVLNDRADLDRLRIPTITHDERASAAALEHVQDLIRDILPVRSVGVTHVSYHLMQQYTDIRGLEQMMIDMFDEPELLKDTMEFFIRAHTSILQQYSQQNLLELNNDGTYHSSGGVGYTDEIPIDGYDPEHIEPGDMWASAESQELAQVGPGQHEEFALQHERRLLEPFALTGYGCCEPLTDRLEMVFSIPGIRRISISPWADARIAAEQLGGDYIFSWKPKPMHLVGDFDEELIRSYLRETIDLGLANNCTLEMILKDTHTCEHHPERFARWSRIAREEVERAVGA